MQYMVIKYQSKKKPKLWSFKNMQRNIFHIDNEPVEIVQNYTYIGTVISSMGNFSLALDKLKEKALQTLYSLKKHTNLSKLPPSLHNRRIFLRISGEQRRKRGESEASAKRKLRASDPPLARNSRFALATRWPRFLPRFRLCSPKIRKKLRLFCRLRTS